MRRPAPSRSCTTVLARLLAFSFSPTGLRIAVPAAVAAMVATGLAFAAVEDRSVGDGLWWAFATVATVGYGDVVPETTTGRVLGVLLMFGGIGFLLLLAGALVEHFVAVEVEEEEDEVLRRLDALSAQVEELARRLDARD